MNRNDPCSCGSGRKFKKCHGAPAMAFAGDDTLSITRRSEIARASAAKAVDVALIDELHAYAHKRYGPSCESRRAGREPAKERMLQAHLDAPIGVWEVQSVERGVGAHVKDLLTGDERFVYDRASSMSLTPWLGLLGYIVDVDGVSFWGALHSRALPPAEVALLAKDLRKLARVRTKPVSLAFRTDPEWRGARFVAYRPRLHGTDAASAHAAQP